MSSTINTNIPSLTAQRNLTNSQSALTTSLQRLSSGLRINSAKDDAAGLAISERLTSQIRGSDQASRNANDGISLSQTAEGDLAQIGTNLQRVRELAVQSSNASNSVSDRASLQNESNQLLQEIDRVAQNSSFNGNKLLDGSFTSQTFQIGANNTANDRLTINAISSSRLSSLGGTSAVATANLNSATSLSGLNAGDLTLNGSQVGGTSAGSLAGQSAASAFATAAAINTVSAASGVTATAVQATTAGSAATAFTGVTPAANVGFSINGVAVGAIVAGTDAAGEGANTAAAINKVTAQSGVTATANATTGAVSLKATDGRDILVAVTGTYSTLTADTGLTAGTTHGSVALNSTNTAGIVVSGATPSKAGLTAGTTNAAFTVSTLSSLDISTTAGATSALDTIDGALSTINNTRAQLGAIQNRFSSVVTSLQTSSENLSASRSRIQDTDFAHETAALTRGQILQQAGTAMLAQANSLPNGVLALLRG